MSNTTKKVLTPNQPVLLEQTTIKYLIEKLDELKERYNDDFEDDMFSYSDRLMFAGKIMNVQYFISLLKDKLD